VLRLSLAVVCEVSFFRFIFSVTFPSSSFSSPMVRRFRRASFLSYRSEKISCAASFPNHYLVSRIPQFLFSGTLFSDSPFLMIFEEQLFSLSFLTLPPGARTVLIISLRPFPLSDSSTYIS